MFSIRGEEVCLGEARLPSMRFYTSSFAVNLQVARRTGEVIGCLSVQVAGMTVVSTYQSTLQEVPLDHIGTQVLSTKSQIL